MRELAWPGVCLRLCLSFADGDPCAQDFEAIHQIFLKRGVVGKSVEIFGLVGVFVQIVDLVLLRLHDVVDEFVAFGADAATGADRFGVGPLKVFVVPLLAEGWIGRLRQGENALALHVRGGGYAGEVEEGRSKIGIENHLVADDAGGDAPGITDH